MSTPTPFTIVVPRGRIGELSKKMARIESWAFRNRFIVALPESRSLTELSFSKKVAAEMFEKTFLAP